VGKQNILFLAANPLDTGRLRLEAEVRTYKKEYSGLPLIAGFWVKCVTRVTKRVGV